jgi:hypothetical protein
MSKLFAGALACFLAPALAFAIACGGGRPAGTNRPELVILGGTFSYFATDLSRYEEGSTEMGGILRRLTFDSDLARTELLGPANPVVTEQVRAIRSKRPHPLGAGWREACGASGENRRAGALHNPVASEFENGYGRHPGTHLAARAGKSEPVVRRRVQRQSSGPPSRHGISSPASFAGDLFEQLGPYRTLGWAEATWPLNEDRMDERTLMDDLYRAFDDRAQVILNRMRVDMYSGDYLHNASELQVGLEDGYRVSWLTTLGGTPQEIVYPNMKKWSGDHGGYDFATTAGVLVSNRPLTGEAALILDIAPTVLKFFGLGIPQEIDGKSLF